MPVTNPFGPLDAAHGYVDPPNSGKDLRLSAILFGLFMGLSFSVLPSVISASGFLNRPFTFTYFKVLVWLQWITCVVFGIILWARFQHYVKPSFTYFFFVLFFWSLQIQFLTQIAVNRVCILVNDRQLRRRVKVGVFVYMLLLCVFVWVGWVPTSLQVEDPIYAKILVPFNCLVMGGIMIADIGINMWFVVTVKRRLIDLGLRKYDDLVKLNVLFLFFAVALDAVTLGLMFMKNRGVYLHIYPIAYIVKLAIELSLSTLIVQIASKGLPQRGMMLSSTSKANNAEAGLTTRIQVLVEEDVKSALTEKVEVLPAFGQFIKRPEGPNDFDHDGSSGYETDDKVSTGLGLTHSASR